MLHVYLQMGVIWEFYGFNDGFMMAFLVMIVMKWGVTFQEKYTLIAGWFLLGKLL